MRIRIVHVLIPLVLFSCQIELSNDPPFLPAENDVALLSGVNYVSHTSSEVVFETELVVLNSFYRGLDNYYLAQEDFDLTGKGTYSIETFSFVSEQIATTPSATILVVDQSGDYDSLDPYNTRSQSITKFLEDLQPPHTFLVGGCSAQGKLSQEPVEFPTGVLSNNWELSSRHVFELSKRTGGKNAMFDGAQLAIEKLSNLGTSMRKELILLAHTDDVEGATSSEELITLATQNGVTIHVIILGNETNKDTFSSLAVDTGGLFVVCPSEKEMTKVFNELERLINGTRGVYKLRIHFKPSQGVVQPGSVISHSLEILDPYSKLLYNPVFITVKIPS